MKEHIVKTYSFKELSEQAQEKALENFYDINVDYDWWQYVYEDANNIGLQITGFEMERCCEGKLLISAAECIEKILAEHGQNCDTFKTASNYKKSFNELDQNDADFETCLENLNENFLHDLLEDYRIILQKEYEYLTSKEAILETIDANEYEFTEDGKLF